MSDDRTGGARTLEARAPAKLNLGLRVCARRDDGYHEIESVFVPLDLADRVVLRISEAGDQQVRLRLRDASPDVPADASNLAVKAAERFLSEAGLERSVEIDLTKRIPSGAGLGGGSSDAGSVLRLLDGAFPEALSAGRLEALALRLGADVPFFLDPRPARVSGVGERREALVGLSIRGLAFLLVHPGAGVRLDTAEVYRAFDALVPQSPRPPLPGHPEGPAPLPDPGGDWSDDSLVSRLRNDLEPAAVRLCPAIRRLRARLEAAGPRAVGLSGSGPTLFGIFDDAAAAGRAAEAFAAPVWARVAAIPEAR